MSFYNVAAACSTVLFCFNIMSNSQLNKLKAGTKNNTEVTLKISSNVIGDSNDEYNFLHRTLRRIFT